MSYLEVCQTIYCHLDHLPANGLLKPVLGQLGEVPKRGKDRLYSQILDRARRTEGTLLLIFDEAHLLSGDALVDLRLLVSSAIELGPPLKILLVGQVSHHGGDPKIFDEGVKDQIHEFTGGNPRGINNAAIACLLHATSKRSLRIDEAMFRQASQELHWN